MWRPPSGDSSLPSSRPAGEFTGRPAQLTPAPETVRTPVVGSRRRCRSARRWSRRAARRPARTDSPERERAARELGIRRSAPAEQVGRERQWIAALLRALQVLGYRVGTDIGVECRVSEGTAADYREVVSGLTRLSVDLIIAIGSGAVRAAKEVGSRMPIVALDLERHPVASGWAAR